MFVYTQDGEKRYRAFGVTANGRYLTIAYMERREKIRPITAWDMTRREKRQHDAEKSVNKGAAIMPPLPFKSEAEEAERSRSPAGRRFSERQFEKAVREGTVMKGLKVEPTDPAVLRELMGRIAAKRTQAVSLRIPVSDIEAAKKLAAEMGLGYQTVLKEIISKALRDV